MMTLDTDFLTPRKDETMISYWLSFSPAAPLFGVDWRFSDMFAAPKLPDVVVKPTAKTSKSATPSVVKDVAPAPVADVKSAPHEKQVSKAAIAQSVAPKVDAPAKVVKAVTPPVQKVEQKVEIPADVKAAPTPVSKPVAKVAAATVDDLTVLKGIGPKLAAELATFGITSYAQIAALSPEALDELTAKISVSKGRPQRDDWIGQAKALIPA